MIEIEITEEMKRRAWRKAREMGRLNNSITKGDGNIAGFLGEEVANQVIRGQITNTYDYDILDDEELRYDVKTKRCTSPPKETYECSVAEFNTKQNCDYYVFVRIEYKNKRWGRAWFLGAYHKDSYFIDAQYLKKGQIDPSNGWKVKANCYNMKIKDLEQLW